MRQLRGIVNHIEVVSFVMIKLVGLGIIWTQVLFLQSVLITPKKLATKPSHVSFGFYHLQGPSVKDLDIKFSMQTFLGIVLSIGFRPCLGALLVAISLGIGIAGLLAVLAMSLGTAIMITVLALFSVYRRQTAQQLLDLFPQKV